MCNDLFPESVSIDLCSTFAFMDKPTFLLMLNLNLFFAIYATYFFHFPSLHSDVFNGPIENSHKTW